MYEERKNSFSIRDIILQVLLIILFVLIMVWLFPTKNYLEENGKTGNNELYTNYIMNMREAALSYYTTDRVPNKIGESTKLTLNEMLKDKLVLEIGGNASCDLEKSYVEVTKMDSNYQLKVQLTCDEFSDYILVTIGCTDFCTICDQTINTKPEESNPQPQSTKKYTVTFDSNGGSAVASQKVASGKKATEPANPTKDGYTFIEWTLNGNTYDFNTAVRSDITLVAQWSKNTITLYKYSKPINSTYTYYSDWSNWSNTQTYWGSTTLPYKNSDLNEYQVISTGYGETGETKKSCTTTTKAETVVVDTKNATTKTVSANVIVSVGTEYSWKVSGQVTSDVPLKTYYKNGAISTEANADTKYTFVETRVVSECESCTNKIVYVYTKSVKVANSIVTYSCPSGYTKSGSGSSTKCTKSEYTCSTYGSDYKLSGTSCIKYGTKNVTTESCKDVAVKANYVKYQYRTRTLKTGTNTSYVYEWSTSSNDMNLIANGYTYTGESITK